MHIIRPIETRDVEAFVKMAFEAGIGMTSMPKNRAALTKRLEKAVKSFASTPLHPGDELYLFVLEDLLTGEIGGTSGILATTGHPNPLSFFRIMKNEIHRGIDGVEKVTPLLRVVHYRNYWSEICSLYLRQNHRHGGLGRLLSLSRFHFIAYHPERFDKMIFAEMRGHIDDKNNSPFWEGIGRHFIDTTFESLMQMRDESSVDLREALPAHPIYLELLPKEVQEAAGKIHTETTPAMKLLAEEGFVVTDDIDICDGGPKIATETKNIRTIRTSQTTVLGEIVDTELSTPLYLLSHTKHTFRACLSHMELASDGTAILPKLTVDALKVKKGDNIRYSLIYSEPIAEKKEKR